MLSLPEKYTAQICELLENSTCFLLERLEKNGSVYPLIDTKFDIPTGKDFDKQEDFRQKDHIYGWIQGRGLEALAGSAAYFRGIFDRNFAPDCIKAQCFGRFLAIPGGLVRYARNDAFLAL